MKEIIIDETSALFSGDVVTYLAKYRIKDTNVTGEYTLTRTCEEGEITTDEIAKKIQEEIYGREYVCGIDYAKGNDITVVVKIDAKQFEKNMYNVKLWGEAKEEKQGREKIRAILDKVCIYTEEAANQIIDELKQGCITYKDLDKAVRKMESEIRWSNANGEDYQLLLNKIKKLIEEEKSSLRINKNYHSVVVRFDKEQIQKIDEIIKVFNNLRQNKRAVVME